MTQEPQAEAYEDRYLAFIDVLGFEDLVNRSESLPEIVAGLSKMMLVLSERAAAARSEELHIEATSFSDTIVLSSRVDATALLRLLEIIDAFSFDLMNNNMLLRGAIVRGQVVHKPQYIFGPALISAYRLETTTSFHPRIMLDAAVYAATREDTDFDRYVVSDSYDVPYLNPFARWDHGEELGDKAKAQLVQLQSIIAAGLMAGSNNPSVGEKYKWLGRKLNRFIRRARQGPTPLDLAELTLD